MVPNYEVKALLDSSLVLDANKDLSSDFLCKFNVVNPPRLARVQYLDTNKTIASNETTSDYEIKAQLGSSITIGTDKKLSCDFSSNFNVKIPSQQSTGECPQTNVKEFNERGWINRIRIKDAKTSFELTYKKRYRIENGNIQAALDLANSEGFDINATSYDAQVDWGYNQMTLSFANQKTMKNTGYDNLELPDLQASIEILTDKIPGKLNDWEYKNWGQETLKECKIYGSILFSKYKGEFEGKEIDIEIWPIKGANGVGIDYFTELSFKEDDFRVANDLRTRIYNYLDKEGVLLHQDSLKTQLTLSRY